MLQGLKILAADDDEMSLEMLTAILGRQGVFCTAVVDGREAMDTLKSNPDFDLILLDLQMPVMDGFEVLSQCKNNPYLSDIPIIVLTSDYHEKIKSLKLGADDFLAKPYDLDELTLRISKLVLSYKRVQGSKRAKDEFLAIACHELRTPMHQIIGVAELLESENLEGEQREFVELLKQSTDSLTGTISDILNYVRLDHGICPTAETFSLRALVEKVLKSHDDEASSKGVVLILDISDDVADALNGSLLYISKVFDILIENAVKYSSDGEITIVVREESFGKHGSRFNCSVSDSGIGISAAFHAKIFEPFMQVDSSKRRKFEGIGLGLAIAQRMVQLMGGTIDVQSDEGRGSTFFFSFHCQLHGT